LFEQLEFKGSWRHYQKGALAAFEKDLKDGHNRTHIVAPPGSGKTVLGVELIRRLDSRALVLSPNSAVQSQWLTALDSFLDSRKDPTVAGKSVESPIACLTYQSLCQLTDPAEQLNKIAFERWVVDRSKATGELKAKVKAESETWSAEAAKRRDQEISRVTATLKREIARGDHSHIQLGDLVSKQAKDRIKTLKANGVHTVVLDECHHLASLWGYVVQFVLSELEDFHLIGLTATPPDELSTDEFELYNGLLGPVDFTVPTPAVVRDGFLAPYQELAWFTQPLKSEYDWLAEHDTRFKELVTELHTVDESDPLSFPIWMINRLRNRDSKGSKASVSWNAFQKRSPKLARAGIRFLSSAGLSLPPGAPRGEGFREPPDLEDWLTLLDDYAMQCLKSHPSAAATLRLEAIGAALRELGFTLTRTGIRRGRSEVDRLLTTSGSKPLALVEILSLEAESRAEGLRALVLCDAELASAKPDSSLLGVLDREAGTAPLVVKTLADDIRTEVLKPLIVSGRGLQCAPDYSKQLLEFFNRNVDAVSNEPLAISPLYIAEGDGGLVRIKADGNQWQPSLWVPLATEALRQGVTQTLVGTRALLGEGWNAPCVNCLVDLTSVTTGVSVRQMRGRSLRLDPDDTEKIASNWDVVCVASDLTRGTSDYRRFVRKHRHLHAPCEDGSIEAGISHVHPRLSPFEAPEAKEFSNINTLMRQRTRDHNGAYSRWQIGTPYRGIDVQTLLVKSKQPSKFIDRGESVPQYRADSRWRVRAAAVAAAIALIGLVNNPLLTVFGVSLSLFLIATATVQLARAGKEFPVNTPLVAAAHAVAQTYAKLGEISSKAANSLQVEPRSSGYLRCRLVEASEAESELFSTALDELLSPVIGSRYLVSRLVDDGSQTMLVKLLRSFQGRNAFKHRWHSVPSDFGRHKQRATVFADQWKRWIGPSQLQFTQRSELGKDALTEATAQSSTEQTYLRKQWL